MPISTTQAQLTDFLIKKIDYAFDNKLIDFNSQELPVGFLFMNNIKRNLRLSEQGFGYFAKFFWHKQLTIGDFIPNTRDLCFIHMQHKSEPYYLYLDKKTHIWYIDTFNEDFCFEYLLNGGLRNLMEFKK